MELTKNEILINKDSLFMDIQSAFAASYPFLKIDFFTNGSHTDLPKSRLIDPKTPVSKLVKDGSTIRINIGCNKTVSELSHDFKNTLGLTAQISRKSGNVWLVVSLTEEWTLQSQNEAGEHISSEMETIHRHGGRV